MFSSNRSTLSGEGVSGLNFVNSYTTKYTLCYSDGSEMPIFKYDGTRAYPDDPSTEKSEFKLIQANEKLQLESSDPTNISYTTLAYNKKQKIEIRNGPEQGTSTLETIPLEWYYQFSRPKLIDLKLGSGRVYRWLWMKQGSYHLVDKTKGSASKDTLVAVVKFFKGGITIISITDAAYEKGSGLTDEIVIVSAIGVIKKCEKDLIQIGPKGPGSAAGIAAQNTTLIFSSQGY